MLKKFLRGFKDDLLFTGKNSKNLSIIIRSRNLRRSLIFIILFVTMVPLVITVGLSFFQIRKLLQEETKINARWSAENSRQTIEAFLDRLRAAILVVSDAYTVGELSDHRVVGKILADLKTEHRGLVDLSFIDPHGVQKSYAGPYELTGKNYVNSPWYIQSRAKKIYVSEVFMGYRNIPHFVIAVSKKIPEKQGYWVLRASIDADTLDRFLASIGSSEAIDDIFLINQHNMLQTSSRFYGHDNEIVDFQTSPRKQGITLAVDERDGRLLIRAVGYIKGTPWILVQEQQGYINRSTWLAFRNQILLLLIACLVFVSIVAYAIAGYIAGNVRKSDESREMLLQETEHTDKLASIGRLAAGVAHEINNPLAIINEKIGLMKDLLQNAEEFLFREKFLAELAALDNAVARTRTITHRLLGFARRMDVSLEILLVTEIIDEVLGFLEKEALYRKINIHRKFPSDLPLIYGDRGQLQQIFLNLLNNAIDALDGGGDIMVTVRQISDKLVQIDIEDNGPGIPSEIARNIFEPFYTTKQGPGKRGTGLGLSITYGLVKKLGGEIYVRSETGQGTVFSLVFSSPVRQKWEVEHA